MDCLVLLIKSASVEFKEGIMSDQFRLSHPAYRFLSTEIEGFDSLAVLADPAFRKNVDELLQAKRNEAETSAWLQQKLPKAPLTSIAYFSMEFMLSEALPIYSGGLGNVTGDIHETFNLDYDAVFGCRRCAAQRWVGSSCAQASSETLQAVVG
jgi:hypothetical protein